jgi:hypothetical protein
MNALRFDFVDKRGARKSALRLTAFLSFVVFAMIATSCLVFIAPSLHTPKKVDLTLIREDYQA